MFFLFLLVYFVLCWLCRLVVIWLLSWSRKFSWWRMYGVVCWKIIWILYWVMSVMVSCRWSSSILMIFVVCWCWKVSVFVWCWLIRVMCSLLVLIIVISKVFGLICVLLSNNCLFLCSCMMCECVGLRSWWCELIMVWCMLGCCVVDCVLCMLDGVYLVLLWFDWIECLFGLYLYGVEIYDL